MTCIAGIADGGRIYLAGDSAGVADFDLIVRADRKVFRNGPFVFGFTTSFRMGQLLQYGFTPPSLDPGEPIYAFMVTRFVDAVRDRLKSGGWSLIDKNREEGGTFLVGFRGRLFLIDSDFQVGESVDGYAAVGCGANLALGALYATRGQAPGQRLATALRAAERWSAGVRSPFRFVVGGET